MKKWMYLLAPAVMLGVFLIFYFSYVEQSNAKKAALKAKQQQEKVVAEEKKKVAESKAREDAKKRQDERDAEERKKEKDRADKQASEDKKVRDQTAEALARGKKAEDEGKALEAQLDGLRKEKDKLSREAFDIAKQVELARVARRNAELEIQRMTEMVTRRASESSMTKPPPVFTPPAPAKAQ